MVSTARTLPSDGRGYLPMVADGKARGRLIADGRGVRVVAGAPVLAAGKVIGGVFALNGLADIRDFLRKQGVEWAVLIQRNGQWVPAHPNLFDPDRVKLAQQVIAQGTSFNHIGDQLVIAVPLEDHGKMIGRQVFFTPDAEYVQHHNEMMWALIGDVAIVVIIDVLINLIILFTVFRDAVRPIQRVREAMLRIAEGDLSTPLQAHSNARDMRDLLENVERMRQAWQQIVQQVREVTGNLDQDSRTTLQDVLEMCDRLKRQRAMIERIHAAAEETAQIAVRMEQTATRSADEVMQCNSAIEQGMQAVGQSVQQIHTLGDDVQRAGTLVGELINEVEQINEIMATIAEIAEQTNLLALNAAIEAARAGEHGRGFAVVADEVRALASRTQQTLGDVERITANIARQADTARGTMETVTENTGQLVEASTQLERTLGEVQAVVVHIVEAVRGLRNETAQQQQQMQTVSQEIRQLDEGAQDITNKASDTLTCFERVTQMVKGLAEQMRRFRV